MTRLDGMVGMCYTILTLSLQDMEAQRLMNINFISAHEQPQTNINAFWGPEQALFTYTTSKWDRESSAEVSSNSDNSYQTPPVVGSSQWDQLHKDRLLGEDGETSLSMKKQLSLSSIQSQPCMLLSGGPTLILK